MMKFLKKFYLGIIMVFLYIPIVILILQSFNAGESRAKWEGFSLHWYGELLKDERILQALYVTVSMAVLAMIVSTILGTLAAIGIHAMKKRPQALMMTLTNLPNTMPDIVTGISLMLLFLFTKVERGYVTMLLAHITFDTPYVILSVLPKLAQMDPDLEDAALDLGCTPTQAFFKVILHDIMPGVISGFMMAFTMSLDDFVISYFVTGSSFITLPVEIYNYTKKPIHPKIYALFTLMFLAILVIMVVMNLLQAKDAGRKGRKRGVRA